MMVMDGGLPVVSLETQADPGCRHHWIIQPALGPLSDGKCRNCGEVREFKNSIDFETEWSSRRDVARSEMTPAVRRLGDLEDLAG